MWIDVGNPDADFVVHQVEHLLRLITGQRMIGEYHDGKFVTAKAESKVHFFANHAAQSVGHFIQESIAELMTKLVINRFEMVNVQ